MWFIAIDFNMEGFIFLQRVGFDYSVMNIMLPDFAVVEPCFEFPRGCLDWDTMLFHFR